MFLLFRKKRLTHGVIFVFFDRNFIKKTQNVFEYSISI